MLCQRILVWIVLFVCYTEGLNVFDRCEDEQEGCPTGSHCTWMGCEGMKCICEDNLLPSVNRTKCVKGIPLGEGCQMGTMCMGPPLSECRFNTLCACLEGYQPSEDGTYCVYIMKGDVRAAEYDQYCDNDKVRCYPDDLQCSNNKCTCEDGFRPATKEERYAEPYVERFCRPNYFKIGVPVDVAAVECQKQTPTTTTTTTTTTSTPPTTTSTTTSSTTSTTTSTTTPSTTSTTTSTTTPSTTSTTTSTTTPSTTSTTTSTTTPSTTSTTTSTTTHSTTSTTTPSTTSTTTTTPSTTSTTTPSTTSITTPTTTTTPSTTSPTTPSTTSTTTPPTTTTPTTTTTPSTTSTTTTIKPGLTSSSTTITTTSTFNETITTPSITSTTPSTIPSYLSTPRLVTSSTDSTATTSRTTSTTTTSSAISTTSPNTTSSSKTEPSITSTTSNTIITKRPSTHTTTMGSNTTKVGIGEKCHNRKCQNNSECVMDSCRVERCRCELGYANSPDGKSCWKLSALGEICQGERICQGQKTQCGDKGVCVCEDGYEKSDSGRWCRLKTSWFIDFPVVGEVCGGGFFSECYMQFEQHCVEGRCRCKEGLKEIVDRPDMDAVYPDIVQCRNESFADGHREEMLCLHQARETREYDMYDRAKSKIRKIQGAIIGGCVGFVAMLGIVIGVVALVRWKRKGRRETIRDTSSTASTDATSRYSFKIPRPFTHFVGSKEYDSTQIAYPNPVFDKEEERTHGEPKPDVVNVGTLARDNQNLIQDI